MSIVIKEATDRRLLKIFLLFQYDLYKTNKYWVPPPRNEELNSLRRDKNPAFEFCEACYWLAYKDGKVAGRIAGIINHKYNDKWNRKDARFGWFDFIDDSAVSSALLETAENWAKQKGMTSIHGPLGFTDMDGEGTLVEGFEETSTLGAIYNYPYYPAHIENCGYKKDTDWVEFEVTMTGEVNQQIKRIAEIAMQRNKLSLLKVKKSKELLPYAHEIFEVLNSAYADLYGFTKLSKSQIDMYVKQYFGFVLAEYTPVILDQQNRVAAFGITMPSLSEAFQKNKGRLFPFGFYHILRALKNNHKADLYLTAVRPDLQNKGVNAILIHEINKVYVKNKIKKVETNRELEGNSKVQAQWRFFDTRQHKRRRCYVKEI